MAFWRKEEPFARAVNVTEKVKCSNCKHYLDKSDCTKVVFYIQFWDYTVKGYETRETLTDNFYFCPLCRPKYEKRILYVDGPMAGKLKYFKLVPEHYEEIKL